MSNKYLEYIKDNPQGFWFKRKLFGWGWMPVKWQGWFVLGIFIVFLIWNSKELANNAEPTSEELTLFFIKILVATVILILICYKKGEKPRWQWGLPKKDGISNKDQ